MSSVYDGQTVIIVTPYKSLSLASCIFYEGLKSCSDACKKIRFLARNYDRAFREVDISFVRDLLILKPQVIGFSSFFWNFDENLRFARLAKSLVSDLFTVFGGPQVGAPAFASALLKEHHYVDAIIIGEADLSFPDLVVRILSKKSIEGLPGLVYRGTEGIVYEPSEGFINDLDCIPPVFHDDNEVVLKSLNNLDVIPLQTVRGCRKNCSYCLYGTSKLRAFPLQRVESEVAFLCKHKAKHVRICDSHFAGSKTRAMEIFKIIEHYSSGTVFHIYPDPLHIDRDYLQAAKKANCRILSLGIETMDPFVGESINRFFDWNEFRYLLELFRETGKIPQVDMMFGLPGQTARSFKKDLVQLKVNDVENVLFSPLMIFPGCNLAARSEDANITTLDTPQRFGISKSISLEEYSEIIGQSIIYDLITQFRRVDYYLRSAFKDNAGYAKSIGRWFDVAQNGGNEKAVELNERLEVGSEYIRLKQQSLAKEAAEWALEIADREKIEFNTLKELARMDILEIAMKKRQKELFRNITPLSAVTKMILPEDLLRIRWILNKESWPEYHKIPYRLASRGGRQRLDKESDRVYCIYFCPDATLFYLEKTEYEFLTKFEEPRLLFDIDSPYSSTIMELAAKWTSRGVLQSAQ